MPSFDIVRSNNIEKKSFRVAQIYDQFDISTDKIQERFTGNIELPENWSIGMIVGKSGTGKTTIANELFGDCIHRHEYKSKCVVDDMPGQTADIFFAFQSVGFSSPPSWLKPYEVLSNGEKMRVDLACTMMSDKQTFAFDEYTSVVDREVAKMGSLAIQKAIRKTKKQFIAIGCHYDVIEWLNPDWYFCTDDMKMYYPRGSLQRPTIKIDIHRAKGFWSLFAKYHYLSNDLSKSSQQFIAVMNESPIAFCAVIMFPHPVRPLWKVHRIVVLPDYQGLGIASKMMEIIATQFNKHDFSITTSLKSFADSLRRNKNWVGIRNGMARPHGGGLGKSSKRNTYSFIYKGVNHAK